MNREWQLITNETIDGAGASSSDSTSINDKVWGRWEIVQVQPPAEGALAP